MRFKPFLAPWHFFLNCHETGPILANIGHIGQLANMGPVSWQFKKLCHGSRNGMNSIFLCSRTFPQMGNSSESFFNSNISPYSDTPSSINPNVIHHKYLKHTSSTNIKGSWTDLYILSLWQVRCLTRILVVRSCEDRFAWFSACSV